MKRILICALAVCVFCACLCGCQGAGNSNSTDATYNMPHALDAHQYCLFVNKHINVVSNQLTTQAMLASRYDGSPTATTDLIASAENALQVMSDSRKEVEIMAPPAQYVENRLNTLRLMDNAINNMTSMLEALKQTNVDKSDVNDFAGKLQTDFIALLAEFDVYYK